MTRAVLGFVSDLGSLMVRSCKTPPLSVGTAARCRRWHPAHPLWLLRWQLPAGQHLWLLAVHLQYRLRRAALLLLVLLHLVRLSPALQKLPQHWQLHWRRLVSASFCEPPWPPAAAVLHLPPAVEEAVSIVIFTVHISNA